MGLFDLFRKSEWQKLKGYPPGVQHDIAYLVVFDSLIKAAVANSIQRFLSSQQTKVSDVVTALGKVLTAPITAHELHLAILATGVGKEFSSIRWSYLPPFSAVSCLGIITIGEFRNAGQLTVENVLKYSGYSADPNEARTQLLVLMANSEEIADLDQVRAFDSAGFFDFWVTLRKTVFTDLQLNVSSESPGLSLATKERFERLSRSRQEILLQLAESLSKKKPNADTQPGAPKVASAPFNLEQSKREHPYCYVPYPKMIHVMNSLSPRIKNFFRELSVDNYELRRVVGAKEVVSEALLARLVDLDANIAAYCIVIAAVSKRDPKFIGCPVWRKITESFSSKNMQSFLLFAAARSSGMFGDVDVKLEIDDPRNASLALNLIQEVRVTPSNYLKMTSNEAEKIRALLAGTIILRHILNHPRYGKSFLPNLTTIVAALDPILDELKNGELLTWDEQKSLPP